MTTVSRGDVVSQRCGLGFLALVGLNLLDPDAFIADRNIARVERGHELDTTELASLSADAVPAIADAPPTLGPSTRAVVERDLSCLREELRRGFDRFGWASLNMDRDIALERLNALALLPCQLEGGQASINRTSQGPWDSSCWSLAWIRANARFIRRTILLRSGDAVAKRNQGPIPSIHTLEPPSSST